MKTWFTADYHLGHANIMKYCGRTCFMTKKDLAIYNKVKDLSQEEQKKFKISEESLACMNKGIIRNHNERIKPEDTVFFLGDFCFKNSSGGKVGEGLRNNAEYYLKRLNGRFIFIKGNHDKNNSVKTIINRVIIKYSHHRICLIHNPEYADTDYKINFVGHVHKNWKFKRVKKLFGFTDLINVGVDVNNFMPKTFEELMKGYYRWDKYGKE